MTKFSTIDHQDPLDLLAPGGRIGLISLGTDFNIEDDLTRMYPEDVSFFTSRVKNHNPLTIENLRSMAPDITAAADRILPGTDLDAIIYACTSGTTAIGIGEVENLVHQARPGVPVSNPVTAALGAFQKFGAKRISILTPYTEAVNQDVAALFTSHGIDVLNIAGFGFEDDTAMTYISPGDIRQAAIDSCAADADLLFISCTALRAAMVLEGIERRLGKPVVSSNQALVWHSLSLVNYTRSITGFGRLLQNHIRPD